VSLTIIGQRCVLKMISRCQEYVKTRTILFLTVVRNTNVRFDIHVQDHFGNNQVNDFLLLHVSTIQNPRIENKKQFY